jgi:hypothetical protein
MPYPHSDIDRTVHPTEERETIADAFRFLQWLSDLTGKP